MCYGCWCEADNPVIDTPAVRAAAEAVQALYEHPDCGAGGNLHIVTDDWNCEDESLAFCLKQIENKGWKDDRPLSPRTEFMRHQWPDSPEKLAVERKCYDALACLTEDERYSALALRRGFWSTTSNAVAPPTE